MEEKKYKNRFGFLTSQILKFYSRKIFPSLKHLRGTTRLKSCLVRLVTLSMKRYPYPKNSVLDKVWDYLIILDACRYDLFTTWLGGRCDWIISNGSFTLEWAKNTFRGRKCKHIVYISANPFISERFLRKTIGFNPFFYLEPVWLWGWNEKLKTVHPKMVNKAVKKNLKKFPNKKFIIHYLQPHHPFIGRKRIIFSGMEQVRNEALGRTFDEEETVWTLFEKGKISYEEFWEAYLSNLDLVMKYVKKIAKILSGKVIITSDHGNHLGENGIYEHPYGLRTEELVKVPWVDLKSIT